MAQSFARVSYNATTVSMTIFMMMLCLCLANDVIHARRRPQTDVIHARRRPQTYTVGDEFGWDPTIPMDTWAEGKTFYAGDILEFRYDDQISNMVVVDKVGYETCKPNPESIEYTSGDDKIQLHFGGNYFIGTYTPEACSTGLKLAITALDPK